MREHPVLPKELAFKRRYNVIGIVIGVISTIVLVIASGYFYILVSFSGGIDGYINNLKPEPNPNSSEMNAEREAATAEINQSFVQLQNILHYNYYETATHDYCSSGQNNFKVEDGYAYKCSFRITKFYGFNGDFRQQMIDFEKNIFSIGWNPPIYFRPDTPYKPDTPMEEMLVSYYDIHSGNVVVSNLPSSFSNYEKDELSLELDFAEKETREFSQFDYMQKVNGGSLFEIYDEKDFQDSSLVIKKITDTDRFVLVISIEKIYYQN